MIQIIEMIKQRSKEFSPFVLFSLSIKWEKSNYSRSLGLFVISCTVDENVLFLYSNKNHKPFLYTKTTEICLNSFLPEVLFVQLNHV